MADRPTDDFDRRFADRLRAHADRAVDKVDASALARHLAEPSNQPRVARRWTAGVVVFTAVFASLVTASALQLLPGSRSPKPVPTGSPGPSASGSLAGPAIDETGTFAGGGLWARHGGNLYLSPDGGASWSRGTIGPNPIAVVVFDAQHAWAVSAGSGSTGNTGDPSQDVLHYVVSRTTDGGGSWQPVDLPGNFPETAPAFSFVDAQHGYLLIAPERFSNGDAVEFATSDGGASWQQVGTAQSTALQYARMFAATANGTLWAGAEATATGAGNGDLLQVSRDGGASWQPVRLLGQDVLSNGDYLLAPPTVLGSTVIVSVASADKLVFYRSTDDGQSWHASVPLAFDFAYGTPAILDATHWLVPAPTGLTIWVTDDAGATWREQPAAGLPRLGPIAALTFADAEHGIAVVSLGNTPAPDGLFITQDAGRTWRPAVLPSLPDTTPSPSPAATGSLDPSALAVWSGGETGLVGGTEGSAGRVDRTNDGGKTWTTVWRPDAPVVYLVAFGSADAVAETCAPPDGDCVLWRTADRGATWTAVGTTPAAVSFSDALHGWRLVPTATPPGSPVGGPGNAAIERTSDGGQTWQTTSTGPCGPGGPIALGPTAIAAQSATSAWLLCTGEPATIMEAKALAVTTDGGATWQVRAATIGSDPSGSVGQIPNTGHPSSLAIAPDGTAWMMGSRMLPLVSRDGGRTWTDLPIGEIDLNSVSAPSPLDDQHGFALMRDPNSAATLLEVTVDGGTTWAARFSWPVSGMPAASASSSP
jgi:photosystem II stability/assembly factor-like uncharacterized protein